MTKNSKDEEQRKILEGGEVAKAQQAATSDGFDKVIDSKSEGFITKQLVSDIAVVALPIVAAASQGLTEDNPRIAAAIEDVSAVMPIITALVSTGNPWAIAAAGIVAVGASLWDLFKGWTGWFGGSDAEEQSQGKNQRFIEQGYGNFASGGSFLVGGQGGVDNNRVAFNATKGERVIVQTPEQQQQQNVNVYNVMDNDFDGMDDDDMNIINRLNIGMAY